MLATYPDIWIYATHLAFWAAFGITRWIVASDDTGSTGAPVTGAPVVARFSRAVFAVHFVAFGVMYAGIGSALFSQAPEASTVLQRVGGTLIIAAGAALMCWALVYFRSWRYRAKLDTGHELATGGPFALVRHPIYSGMNLLALGTAVWLPNLLTGAAVVLMVVGSDLRGRMEEGVLTAAFGEQYRAYCARTKRFLPGIY